MTVPITANLTIEVIDPLTDSRWGRLLEGSDSSSIFHHPSWLRLLHQQYGYRISAWCLLDAAGSPTAGLPVAEIRSRLTGSRMVALPFSDVCPPLGDRASVAQLAAACHRATGRRLEIHAALPEIKGASIETLYFTHVLQLGDDPQGAEDKIKKSHIRNARKAVNAGLTVERLTDRNALDTFYRLHLLTRRRQGVPTQPKSFIRRFASLFDEGLGFVMLVRSPDRPAAAAVFLHTDTTLTYKYGASDPNFLGLRPNDLLFLEAIRWASNAGFASIDFGRTDLANEGLARFKRSWGAEEGRLAYTSVGGQLSAASESDGVLDRVAATAIRRGPPQLGALLGTVLYKHYG